MVPGLGIRGEAREGVVSSCWTLLRLLGKGGDTGVLKSLVFLKGGSLLALSTSLVWPPSSTGFGTE